VVNILLPRNFINKTLKHSEIMLEMEKLYYYIGQPKTENCLPKTKSLSYATQKN